MTPLLSNPTQPWKKAAFSQYPRGEVMGYSMRTDRYRYTEWRNLKSSEIKARELYDHEKDPKESANIVDAPENKNTVADLAQILRNGYQGAKP
jgi:tRNA A58 N-methylase Trm61